MKINPTSRKGRERSAASATHLTPLFLLYLCGGDAADQVFLFLLAFGADGEGVEQS